MRAIDRVTGALTVEPDAGGERTLDASYVAGHLEHAYALTGHGTQGATMEWAGVVGRPSEFTAEWAYTALSRARGQTRVHVIAEPPAGCGERERYAPPELAPTLEQALNTTRLAMRHHQAERLALEQIGPEELPGIDSSGTARLPLAELAEAGAEHASAIARLETGVTTPGERARTGDEDREFRRANPGRNGPPPPEPDWLAVARRRDAMQRGPSINR